MFPLGSSLCLVGRVCLFMFIVYVYWGIQEQNGFCVAVNVRDFVRWVA